MATYPTDIHPGTTATPGGFKATGYVASKPGDPLNVNPAPGINWFQKFASGDLSLTDAERASQLANVTRINNEAMAAAQAKAAAQAAQAVQGPPRMPAPIRPPGISMGPSREYQIPTRQFTWETTPQEQALMASAMERPDLARTMLTGQYGPLTGQQYQYQGGRTAIDYGPGGGGYGWPTGGWPTGGYPTGGTPTGKAYVEVMVEWY